MTNFCFWTKKAIIIVSYSKHNSNTTPQIQLLTLVKFDDIFTKQYVLPKINNSYLPFYFKSLFSLNTALHWYHIRQVIA